MHTSQRAGLCISALLVGLALVTTEAIRSGCRLIAWLMRLFIMNLKVGLSADQGSLLSGLVFIDLVMRGTLLALGDDLGSLIDAAGRFSLYLRVLTRLVDDVLLHLLLMLLQHVVRHGALVRRISPLHQWMMVPIQSSLLLLLLFVLGPSAHMGRGRGLVGGEGCRRCGSVRVSGIRAHRWDVVVGLRAVTACARGASKACTTGTRPSSGPLACQEGAVVGTWSHSGLRACRRVRPACGPWGRCQLGHMGWDLLFTVKTKADGG